MKHKNTLVAVIGGPGTGKGTYSRMLMTCHDFSYVDTGALLRALPPEFGLQDVLAAGNFAPEDIVFRVVSENMPLGSDVVLDGFPRTVSQAQWLVSEYADKFDVKILFLDAPDDVLIARIHKRADQGSSRPEDYDESVIRHRIEKFKSDTMPAIDWLRDVPDIAFYAIDASHDVDTVYIDICQVLDLKS